MARGNHIRLRQAATYIRKLLEDEDTLTRHGISTQWLALMASDLDDLAEKLLHHNIDRNSR